jgi:5-amino-6-(5-phosphoribosylamino)uracil reductase
MIVHGPGSPFELFLDSDSPVDAPQRADADRGLPAAFREVYRGDWVLPDTDSGVYCYSNFVMSHDGRVSFAVPGHEGGGDVSGFNAHDQWLMGLLRARADAVIVGANTLRSESEHVWTPEFIAPTDAEGFAALRQLEGRSATPVQVFVTRTGGVAPDAAVFHQDDLTSVIVTTESGARHVESLGLSSVNVIVAGSHDVDLAAGLSELGRRFGVSTVLCEGGPRVYGAFVAADLIDEAFVTLSPVMVGADSDNPRPGLIEGLALAPDSGRRANLLSVRRAANHLFVRSAYS